MSRPKPLSGFPEFLPAGRVVEQAVLDSLRATFELHGFASIETRAVEPMDSLARKGEITKEVYVVRRLHAAEGEAGDDLGLHFDLTVPFARYVLENAGHLAFPFRRYQIQKVWRGERPQEGRYREFVQADIDIVGEATLADHHDVEVALVMLEALEGLRELGVPPVTIHVNNRKLAEGFYRGLGVEDHLAVLQRVDKLDKIGPDAVGALLVDELGMDAGAAGKCLELATITSADESFVDAVRALGVRNELLDEGLDALASVVRAAARVAPGRVIADLKIARGLDYYTGTVYETQLVGFEQWGSFCSGGRYDALASDGRTTYPGVGISIGLSRLLALLFSQDLVRATRKTPAAVLVAVNDEESRARSVAVATALRSRGIACEIAPAAARFGKQIRYAERRGIPFVWFPGAGAAGNDQVKDIRSGEQLDADATTWICPSEDLHPRVVATAED